MDQNLCFLLGIDSPDNKRERSAFLNSFAEAFDRYEMGEWDEAIEKFKKVLANYVIDGKEDGTSRFLLEYMEASKDNQEYEDFVSRDYARVSPDE